MSLEVVPIHYTSEKNCFVTLPSSIIKKVSTDTEVIVFEILTDDGKLIYASVNCAASSSNQLRINGLFADKLGLKDEQQVLVRCKNSVPICSQVSVEPLSCDDWEILEKHSSYVEGHLLDQVRIVWGGLVLPVWVERNICVFLKIAITSPNEDCVLLVQDTEVIVSPKVRGETRSDSYSKPSSSSQNEDEIQKEVKQNLKSSSKPRKPTSLQTGGKNKQDDSVSVKDAAKIRPQRTSFHDVVKEAASPTDDDSEDSSSSQMSSSQNLSPSKNLKWSWKEWVPWLLGVQNTSSKIQEPFRDEILNPRKKSIDYRKTDSIPDGINFTFRVQSMAIKYSKQEKSQKSKQNEIQACECLYLQQPAIVFVNSEDLTEQTGSKNLYIPGMFTAKMSKIRSPKDRILEIEKELSEEKKNSKKGAVNKKIQTGEKDHVTQCIVKVIVLDSKKTHSNKECVEMLQEVTKEQPLLSNHVMIPDLLRRLMKLDVTSCVWLQTTSTFPVIPNSYDLYPVGNLPSNYTNQMVQMAFRNWITSVTTTKLPLIIFSGLLVSFPLFQGTFMEFQFILPEDTPQQNPDVPFYSAINQGNMNDVPLNVIVSNKIQDAPKWPVMPMLQYTNVEAIDPLVPKALLSELGGIEEYKDKALSHIEVCLGIKPLADNMFRLTTPGLHNGMLLITGSKGCGKTSFAHAICRKMAERQNLARIFPVDCKPLRGKRPDSILKQLKDVFEEAVWRHPSIILLDDLDHLVPAPSGPEAELSGEAIYGARTAEVIRDILRKDIANGARLAIVATSQSRTSIHPLLVTSRGTHFLQEQIRINPPDKKKRKDILTCIIRNRSMVSLETLAQLDCNVLLGKTEGFVARDLENLVSRAIHCHTLRHEQACFADIQESPEHEMILTQMDFNCALNGFTPASIRNVPLHQAGELGWDDVGGLTDIKKTLKETLLWPSKYPLLFSSCPLRLRSGLLLYGAPGTGKTLLAGVVAKECGLNFISIKGPELLSKYIGASEQAVRDNFIRAQSAKPCILFFDEFDSLAPRRGHDNTGVTDRVVNQLLTQLDGVEGLEGVYVLAATSRPDLIDPALLRPGRLDKCLMCQLPDEKERLKIFEALTKKMSLSKTVNLEYFAKNCEHFTGADIKALLYNAQLEAIHELTGNVLKGDNPDILERNKRHRSPRKSKSSKKLLQKMDTLPMSKRIVHIPKLQDGLTPLTEETEEKFSGQVEQIRGKLMINKASEHVSTSETLFSPVTTSKPSLVQINQGHMMAAFQKTHPSVNEKERHKYQQIYQNFTAARGGNFGTNVENLIGSRQTLA